ncbi:hypothetical protein MMC30_006509 [Trapelia coarctata]|nr:hypothetical protein [Trapelia coarctata]
MAHIRSESLDSIADPIVSAIPLPMMPDSRSSSSLFYTMLPGAVKLRLSTMPSLRKSIGSYSLRPSRRPRVPLDSRPRSADYSSIQIYNGGVCPSGPSFTTSDPGFRSGEVGLGTGWKYANQGMNLLGSAVTEAQYPDKDNQAFARQLYIHALGYLLQGLPPNLSEAEARTLQASIPASLHSDNTRRDGQVSSRITASPPAPSLLHRLLASGIVQLFIFFSFIVPYIKVCLGAAYRYERTHRVSERVFAAGVDLMDQVGQRSFGIAGSVMQIGNGKVGALMAGTCAWWIEGISGGIHDGVGEGMALMGAQETRVSQLRGGRRT